MNRRSFFSALAGVLASPLVFLGERKPAGAGEWKGWDDCVSHVPKDELRRRMAEALRELDWTPPLYFRGHRIVTDDEETARAIGARRHHSHPWVWVCDA